MSISTRMNYIFVDYENIQVIDLDLIAGKAVKVFLVVGQRRKSLPSDLARKVHQYHDQVEWIDSEGASKNALDLVLAYHVGQQAKTDPDGHFRILAKDKDYDALIKHLRTRGILTTRDESFAAIPALGVVNQLSFDDQVKLVTERFKKNQASRPKRKNTLQTTINAFFRKELTDVELDQIVKAMVTRKLIELTPQGAVTYRL